MKPWGVLDAETDPFRHRRFVEPFLWGFFDGTTYRTFPAIENFLTWIDNQEQGWLVYAHNGGKFDYHFLLDKVPHAQALYAHTEKGEKKLVGFDTRGSSPRIIGARLAEFRIGKTTFRDSYNILPVPLSAYAKDEIDYAIFEKDKRDIPDNRAKIEAYLKKDCEYLYDIVKQWRDTHGGGLTLAGTAMKRWQDIAGVEAPESTEGFYQRVSPWYLGGRVECFRSGIIQKPFSVYDINSAYPYAMYHQHPISVGYSVKNPSAAAERPRTSSLYHLRAVSDGAFPIVNKATGALEFPQSSDGPHDFHVTGWEYLAAMETKTAKVLKIYERLDFNRTINFQKYVDHFYGKRMQAKAARKKCADKPDSQEYRFQTGEDIVNKTLLTGLYGKFGANPKGYKQFTIIEAKHHAVFQAWRLAMLRHAWMKNKADNPKYDKPWPEQSDWSVNGEWPDGTGKRILMQSETRKKRYYNVATAASITGFVRAYLWRNICAMRKRGGDVLYTDTDSITVGFPGQVRDPGICLGDAVGQWKCEKTCNYGAIAGKKLYAFRDCRQVLPKGESRWKIACKGVRITAEQIVAVAQGKEFRFRQEAATAGVKGINRSKYVHAKTASRKRASKTTQETMTIRHKGWRFTDRHVRKTV